MKRFVFPACAAVLLLNSGAFAQVPSSVGGAETGASAKPAAAPGGVSEKGLSDWEASVRPEIEKIAGATFDKPVTVKLLSMDDLAQMLAEPIIQRMTAEKATRPDGKLMTPMEIRIRAMAAAFKVASRTFGIYWHADKTVYVLPENAARYAKKYGWSAETLDRAPKLALAHELVHALQDKQASLTERSGTLSGVEREAFVAVTEGHAFWVTDQLAKKLDWPAANAVLWGVVTGVQTADDPTGTDKMPKPKVSDGAPTTEAYEAGKKFMEAQAASTADGPKGAERLWAVLRTPPKSMDELKEPEKFTVK